MKQEVEERSCKNCKHSDANGAPSTFPQAPCFDCSRLGNWEGKD